MRAAPLEQVVGHVAAPIANRLLMGACADVEAALAAQCLAGWRPT